MTYTLENKSKEIDAGNIKGLYSEGKKQVNLPSQIQLFSKTGENRVVRPLCVCSQVSAGASGGKGSVVCPKCFVFSSLS